MEDTLRKFKLDNKAFDDFDALMEKHLDNVEELTVSGIANNSKILNIISLCINIKTLIIEGDQRTNVNGIIFNICKPQLLENLILNGVKLPTDVAMAKLTKLKMISLNNILYSNVKTFIDSIAKPEKIQAITFENVDFTKNSISILNRLSNLNILNLTKVNNCSLTDLEFLLTNKKLIKVNIENNQISFKEANTLLKGKYKKNIVLDLPSNNKESKITNTLEVNNQGKIAVTLNATDLEEFEKEIDISKINSLLLIIEQKIEIEDYLEKLNKINGKISLAIKDVSMISKQQAEKLKELNIEYINILDLDGVFHSKNDRNCYSIDCYIKLRECVDELVKKVSTRSTKIERFLELYKVIIENIDYDDFVEDNIENYNNKNEAKASNLENGLIDKHCVNSGFAEILKNCLACIDIDSKIISGTYGKSDKEITWNQVEIDNYWYNVDIALDSKKLLVKGVFNKKAPYCLLSDKDFYQTHKRKVGNAKQCIYTVNRKTVNGFFRTGIFSDKLTKAYMYLSIEKILKIFTLRKNKALPSGETGKEE
jgi:transglutaminase/protease-like cytokinesis protein 3